jgi:ketosteroid isomerase-like protein
MSQESVEVASCVRFPVSRSSQKASRHRSLDERIFVRFPALYRALAGRLFQLPPRSRLRRLILDRVARRAVAAANRRDFEVLLYGLHPAIEFELPDSPVGGYVPPDLTGIHRGHAGYRHMWEGMLEAWPDLTLEPEEIIDFGNRLVAAGRITGHGRHSGIELDAPLFQFFTLSRGLVVRQKDFTSRDQALEALELSE